MHATQHPRISTKTPQLSKHCGAVHGLMPDCTAIATQLQPSVMTFRLDGLGIFHCTGHPTHAGCTGGCLSNLSTRCELHIHLGAGLVQRQILMVLQNLSDMHQLQETVCAWEHTTSYSDTRERQHISHDRCMSDRFWKSTTPCQATKSGMGFTCLLLNRT